MKSKSDPYAVSPRRWPRLLSFPALALAVVAAAPSSRAGKISDTAKAQIADVLAVKETFTPAEKKMSSALVFARRKALGENIGEAAKALTPTLGASDFMKVEIHGRFENGLTAAVGHTGAAIASVNEKSHMMLARVTVDSLAALAARPDVESIRIPSHHYPNVGSVTSQGTVSLESKAVNKNLGIIGTGVKVGVLSDSASAARVAALMKSGDLGPNTKVLFAGPTIAEGGTDEGTAMMEIVQDMAPGATVEFHSVYVDENFDYDISAGILALKADGCQVIVDDFGGPEGVFQDDIDAITINEVSAQGAIYLSSAGNSGNLAHGTSGVWEGDFLADTTDDSIILPGYYELHNFGTPKAPQNYDVSLDPGEQEVFLTWADPLQDSENDYDLFVLDSTGTTLKGFSVTVQNAGNPGYPAEVLAPSIYGGNYDNETPGDELVIAKNPAAAPLAMHIDIERGLLSNATVGATYGHNAASNTVCCGASYWNSAGTGVKPFDGTHNPVETFSSDGPRRIFFYQDGTPIHDGNYLFSTKGYQTLAKPTVIAVDGATCATVGPPYDFPPFFGTSAAAPHAAGVTALAISARISKGLKPLTSAQLLDVLARSTLNNEAAAKFDPAGGYGTLNAPLAVKNALALP